MSISIKTVITQALQEPGILAIGEEADGDKGQLALSLLNQVVAQLNTEQLIPFSKMIVTHNTTGSVSYTIGVTNPASDINYVRPIFINKVLYRPNGISNPLEVTQLPIGELLQRQLSVGSTGTPLFYAYDGGYPAGTIYFDIAPSAGSQITIVYNKALPVISAATEVVDWPDEYQDMITMALARKIATRLQMPQDTIANCDKLFQEALDRVKTNQSRAQIPTYTAQFRRAGFKGNILAGY